MTDGEAFAFGRVMQLLQTSMKAPTPLQAALAIMHLHTVLGPLRKGDAIFEAEWNSLLGGRFTEVVGSRRARVHLGWGHVFRAEQILIDLLDRHGLMDFHAGLQQSRPTGNLTDCEVG